MSRTDWNGVVAWLVVGVLIVLTAGTPDLLDAITAWVGRQ